MQPGFPALLPNVRTFTRVGEGCSIVSVRRAKLHILTILSVLVGCSPTVTSIVRRDEQEVTRCGSTTWVGHVVETCDLRLPWYGSPRWVDCRTTLTDPLGFTATKWESGEVH